nr:MAG TPA_asm: hypothetical protein [Bacteriophage sp.]DAO03484.1 MAG TPA: hypothetical protein [Caudoviricetes sp.]
MIFMKKNVLIKRFGITLLILIIIPESIFPRNLSDIEVTSLFLEFIFGILCIILFFKIWSMTNDVSQIKNLIEKSLSKKEQEENEENLFDGKEIDSDEKKMRNENPSEIGEWSENISWKEKKNAAPIIEFLKKDQIIISQNGEMMICDEKELSSIKGEYKVVFRKIK